MKLKYTDFIKSVSVLITGTFIAQFISISVSPFIARIYGPEENAFLGLFLKISVLIATIATARLEFVLPIEKKNHYAFGIYQFSFFLSVLISAVCLVFILVFTLLFVEKISLEEIIFFLTIPIGIGVISFFNLGNNWELRNENYREISNATVKLAVFSNAFKFFGLFLNGNFLILIFATIFGYVIASIRFFKTFLIQYKSKFLLFNSPRTKLLVKQNKDFYTYNLFHVLVDLSRDMLIATFIWIIYSKSDFGSYEFSMRMLKLPIVFIGAALSQVFYRKAKDLLNESKKFRTMTYKTLLLSVFLGIVPFTLLYFYGTDLFSIIFGSNWQQAGKLSELMAIWLFVNFIFAPISYIPILLNKQKEYFWINFTSLFVLIGLAIYSYLFRIEFDFFIILLSVLQSTLLLVLIFWFLFQSLKLKVNEN